MSTPYDLRFNLIHFARDQLVSEYNAALERIVLTYPDNLVETRAVHINNLKYPTKDDILKLAEEFKSFTDKK